MTQIIEASGSALTARYQAFSELTDNLPVKFNYKTQCQGNHLTHSLNRYMKVFLSAKIHYIRLILGSIPPVRQHIQVTLFDFFFSPHNFRNTAWSTTLHVD